MKNETAAKPPFKRQHYWVDAPLQLHMVGYVLLMVSACLLLTAFSVYRGVHEAAAQSRQIFHSLSWFQDALRGPLLLAALISLLATAVLTLFWSHRFAGPLRVIAAALARVRHGNLAMPVRVRAGDAHQDLARELQQTQEALRARIEADRARVEEIAARLEAALQRVPKDGEAAADITRALHELKRVCAEYHL